MKVVTHVLGESKTGQFLLVEVVEEDNLNGSICVHCVPAIGLVLVRICNGWVQTVNGLEWETRCSLCGSHGAGYRLEVPDDSVISITARAIRVRLAPTAAFTMVTDTRAYASRI